MSALRTFRALPRFAINASRSFSSTPAAANMARMTLIGRLAGPPESTQTSSGKTVIRYAVATNSGSRDNPQTNWFNISVFVDESERGENRLQYMASLEKGSLVFVEADGRMATYEGEDGKKHKALNLIQRNFRMLARPKSVTGEDEAME